MIELKIKNKEVDITLNYSRTIGDKPKVEIIGEGDLSHHLVEGLFDIIDKLARMEEVDHNSKQWRNK